MKNIVKNIFVAVLLLSVFTCIFLSVKSSAGKPVVSLNIDDVRDITASEFYYYENGEEKSLESTKNTEKQCDDLSYYYTIKDEDLNGDVLAIETKVRNVENATINGNETGVKTYRMDTGAHTFWNFVNISGVSSGDTVALNFSDSEKSTNIVLKEAKVGMENSIYLALIKHYAFILIFMAIGFFIGLCYIVAGLINLIRYKNQSSSFTLFIGIFFVLFDLWQFCSFQLFSYSFNNQIIDFCAQSALMLFPIPILQFSNYIVKTRSKGIDLLCILMIENYVIVSLLYHFKIIDYSETPISTYILIAISAVFDMVIVIKNLLKKQEQNLILSSIGLIILDVVCCGMLIYTAFPDISSINSTTVTLIASVIMFLSFIFDSTMSVYNIKNVQKNADFYKEVAFIDSSTMVASRTAYNDYLEKANFKALSTIEIVVVDLNNLKSINDNFGHQAGDKIIRSTALMIKDAFINIGTTFRYGGDEFVVVCENAKKEDVLKHFDDLKYLIDYYNDKYDYQIDFAYGIAGSEEFSGGMSLSKVEKVFNLADERMYKMKKESKKVK